MDVQGPVVVTYLYQLHEGEVRVEKIEWRRELVDPVVTNAPKSSVLPQAIPSGSMSPGPTAQNVW